MGQLDSGNAAWILTSASLVFLMTPGVAFFYGGMVRAKAVLNMMIMEAAALSVTMIMWVLWGWSIAYAGTSVGGIFGDPATGFLLKDTMVSDKGVFTSAALNGNNYPVSVDVAFQSAFAMITVALICGAIAERVKYSTWMIFVALWITFDYAPLAHMVWNGGLLSADGAISQAIGAAAHDFAGGTVVHINAAVAALVIVLIIGMTVGSIAGYCGGKVDLIIMRIVDIIYSLPDTLMVILLATVLKVSIGDKLDGTPLAKIGSNIISLFIVFAVLYWVSMARLIRGQILSLREQEYVLAAQATGAKGRWIITRHLVPNCMSVIFISTALQIPNAIFTESFLSYLGLGVNAPMPSLGSLASDALNGLTSYPYRMVIPALVISLIVLSLNLFGDGLRDAFDPKLNG
jgi:ABC-type dipeptide/oligopeptide/nickel transport system permease subunit